MLGQRAHAFEVGPTVSHVGGEDLVTAPDDVALPQVVARIAVGPPRAELRDVEPELAPLPGQLLDGPGVQPLSELLRVTVGVEARFTVQGTDVRDSKNPHGGHLSFTTARWADFLTTVRR